MSPNLFLTSKIWRVFCLFVYLFVVVVVVVVFWKRLDHKVIFNLSMT